MGDIYDYSFYGCVGRAPDPGLVVAILIDQGRPPSPASVA